MADHLEKIPVFIRYRNGKAVCICHAGFKGCGHACERDVVTRDKYRHWQETINKSRYGK